ncbi:hypothetical protein [Asticcacaulis sp. EMRT-3]|uniref:hypothetical protein n=1 Tax=Asticcacaulis sp. EMRT-3 TaxID=3040349 RepID=UPI0024AEC952|nr:hypothetical protein [Asticcacaulis sp. EMRT-3]MDI7774590.1 hypothetical protein [Asticcacaulis sp. EMRT-3]
MDPVTSVVVAVFSTPGAALIMAGLLLVFGIGLIVFSGFTEYKALREELRERWNLLSAFRGPQARKNFHDQFAQIDIRFSGTMSNAATSAALVLGWSNFRSLLADTGEGSFATSARAAETFDSLDEPARVLEWWANILVAIGLAVTFLGIVAALSEATAGMGHGDSSAMEQAIIGLLAIASTKFWTSIAGVTASIILRIVARLRRKRIAALEAMMFEALDACVQFLPPEKVMVEQLRTLGRIEQALTKPTA